MDCFELYNVDLYSWSREQAAVLRLMAAGRVNAELDLDHLADEIEGLGAEQAYALESALLRIMERLLKLQHSPAQDPRAGWEVGVVKHRREARWRLQRNPGLKGRLDALFADAWADARATAVATLVAYDGVDPAAIPAECPWTVAEVMEGEG